MKFWTVSIAVLALAAAALAGGSNHSVSMATLTSSKNVLMPSGNKGGNGEHGVDNNGDDRNGSGDHHGGHGDNGHGGGGGQCVPEPLTMLALVPGVALLIRRRKA